ncbi:hypothetical protein IWQ61_010770 [Dispira simplex]|nr:hypothetical protein IWQ61_010770 [Dispira simplex]
MMPTHIIPLDDMPKTRNGKVDRRALAEYPLPRTLTDDITYVDNASEFSNTYRLVSRLALQALRFPEAHPLPAPSTSLFTMGVEKNHPFDAISAYCEAESGMKKVTLETPSLSHFQLWLSEGQRGSTDMVVELQDTDQTVGILKQPLDFTSASQWQNVSEERNSAQLEIDLLLHPKTLLSR